jgi:GNAT superfamily N-acetyltransferase
MTVRVRVARADDELAVCRLLDAAMLSYSVSDSPVRLLAETDGTAVGALLASEHERGGGAHVDAVAVRRARRGDGIGSELVGALIERYGRVTADCRPGVWPFYESMGFRCREREGRVCALRP